MPSLKDRLAFRVWLPNVLLVVQQLHQRIQSLVPAIQINTRGFCTASRLDSRISSLFQDDSLIASLDSSLRFARPVFFAMPDQFSSLHRTTLFASLDKSLRYAGQFSLCFARTILVSHRIASSFSFLKSHCMPILYYVETYCAIV